MKPKTWIYLIMAVLLAAAWPARAAFTVFFHMDGLAGESQVSGHSGDIPINSFGWGIATNTSGQPAITVTLQKYVSVNSPTLAGNCANGVIAPTATLSCYKPGGGGTLPTTAFYSLSLTNVQVAGVTVTNDTVNGLLDETVSLQFTGIQWTYVPLNPDGTYGTPVVTSYNAP